MNTYRSLGPEQLLKKKMNDILKKTISDSGLSIAKTTKIINDNIKTLISECEDATKYKTPDSSISLLNSEFAKMNKKIHSETGIILSKEYFDTFIEYFNVKMLNNIDSTNYQDTGDFVMFDDNVCQDDQSFIMSFLGSKYELLNA